MCEKKNNFIDFRYKRYKVPRNENDNSALEKGVLQKYKGDKENIRRVRGYWRLP
jgi:hypothetical protein